MRMKLLWHILENKTKQNKNKKKKTIIEDRIDKPENWPRKNAYVRYI